MSDAAATRRAAVIGGGIAGLCAAYDLVRQGWQVAVYEGSERWGGKVWSTPVGARPVVDAGPDTFLARAPQGRQLCRELGLEPELVSPVTPVPAYIARSGTLYPLPAGSVLGVPSDLDALARNGVISPEGVERARVDLDAEATPLVDGDISIGALCRERLGDEITDWLVDPLLGGINASDIDSLSLRAGAPLLSAAYDLGPSLIKSLADLRPSAGPTLGSAGKAEPVFLGLPGGTARIIDALVAFLAPRAELHLNAPITALAEATVGGAAPDATVVAVPTAETAQLVGPVCPPVATELEPVGYASVAQVVVEVPRSGVEAELDASGILFPRVAGTVITACTWLSSKWAHYHRPDSVLLRLSSGRFGDARPAGMGDDELVAHLLDELRTVQVVTAEPTAARVQRIARAFPQYAPGHNQRVARAQAALAEAAPTVVLAGAPYQGIGLPACIQSGRDAARRLLDVLS